MTFYEFVQAAAQRIGTRPSRLLREAFKFGLTAFLVLIVISGVGMAYSSRPAFCAMCHYMKPYYESWQKSAHHNVSCIECHFPPSVQLELQRKFQALVQVVKYATGQYGTRPWTQIDDASCLRSGCHETRLLQSKVDFKGVQFDHLPHLTSFRRVTRLRCTACHSQIVQGQHMTVTENTCFLCHFKQGVEGDPPSDCSICHKFPIDTKGKFDHSFVEKRGIDCQECHAEVVHGEGEVPRDRCLLCHSEPERLQRYDDTAFIHENHVTARKIDCAQCHNAVQHGAPEKREYLASARSDLCSKCHHDQHDQVAQLYAGQGAVHIPGEPAPMDKAGVTCQACHRAYGTSPGALASHTGAGGCMMCHGETFGADLARWREEFGAPVVQLNAALHRARDLVAAVPTGNRNRLSAWYLVDRAATNGQFVQDARGLHNPQYARRILGVSALEANRALGMVGLSYRVPLPASAAEAVSGACTTCHSQVPTQTFTVYGVAFDHGVHVRRSGAECNYCHQGGLPEQPGHGRPALAPENCRACHAGRISSPHPDNWAQVHGPQAATRRQTCNVCHDSSFCSRCHGLTMPHPQNWPAIHGRTALQQREVCSQCHKPSRCDSCHGTAMPHPSDWVTDKHGPTYRANKQLCWRCHQGKDCAQCHDLPMPHPSDWVTKHGRSAPALAGDCATCHQTADCLTCHRRLPPSSHLRDWAKQHPDAGKKQPDLCGLCHPATKGSACLTCHGLPMPHPNDFATTHAKLASFDKNAVCFHCHDRKKFCTQCHDDTG